jgi:hypothetical protein
MIYMHLLTWVGFGLIAYVSNTLYTYIHFVNTYILYIETPRPDTTRHVHAHKCLLCGNRTRDLLRSRRLFPPLRHIDRQPYLHNWIYLSHNNHSSMFHWPWVSLDCHHRGSNLHLRDIGQIFLMSRKVRHLFSVKIKAIKFYYFKIKRPQESFKRREMV